MNVFKTYSNLSIVIFILSLKTFNAPSDEEIKERIAQCVQDINNVFGNGSLYQHAVRAMSLFEYKENLERPALNRCVVSFGENLHIDYPRNSNVCVYYCSFRKYLLVGEIPDLDTFCIRFIGLLKTPGNCFGTLFGYYSADRKIALQKAFYKYRLGRIPTVKLTIRVPESDTEALQQTRYIDGTGLRPYVEEIGVVRYVDVSLAYFDSIKSTFGLKIQPDNDEDSDNDDDSDNDKVDDRMLNPLEFCTKRYSKPEE